MTFRVGQKVVCVRTMPGHRRMETGVYPEEGPVYVVRSIFYFEGRALLRLQGIDNTHLHYTDGIEPGFNAKNFRPVVERKTDISIFTAMLKPSKVNA